jgi:hypothetical protein
MYFDAKYFHNLQRSEGAHAIAWDLEYFTFAAATADSQGRDATSASAKVCKQSRSSL